MTLETLNPYHDFHKNIESHKVELCKLIQGIKNKGEKIYGYGASTKGNVILQYCGLSAEDIPYIAEVNEDKIGSFTPFTHISIISEVEARKMKPDYFWFFLGISERILEKEEEYLNQAANLFSVTKN